MVAFVELLFLGEEVIAWVKAVVIFECSMANFRDCTTEYIVNDNSTL